jgi:hypothetical protein
MIASDYAVLPFKGGRFYYGYESTVGDPDSEEGPEAEWCFELQVEGEKEPRAKLAYSELASRTDRSPSMFNVAPNLLSGIAVCFDRGILCTEGGEVARLRAALVSIAYDPPTAHPYATVDETLDEKVGIAKEAIEDDAPAELRTEGAPP